MKRLIVIILAIAAPASGQSRVYTNADLGRPLESSIRLSPAEAAAVMAAHQPILRATVAPADGPRVFVFGSNPGDGPFGPLWPFWPSQRLDGTEYSQPLDVYGQPLWWYGGPSARPRQARGRAASSGRPMVSAARRRR